VQAAAPSRASLEDYQNLTPRAGYRRAHHKRFGRPGYAPIVLSIEHHDAGAASTSCTAPPTSATSPACTRMNLVAKEFVASRDDEQACCCCRSSPARRASRPRPLIVNPYDLEQTAAAMHLALSMSPDESRARMRSMRHLVQEFTFIAGGSDAGRRCAHAQPQARAGARPAARAAPPPGDAALAPPRWAFFLRYRRHAARYPETPDAAEGRPRREIAGEEAA